MQAEIISSGTELLLGAIVDTNAAYISRQLAEIGIDLYYRVTVWDKAGNNITSSWYSFTHISTYQDKTGPRITPTLLVTLSIAGIIGGAIGGYFLVVKLRQYRDMHRMGESFRRGMRK